MQGKTDTCQMAPGLLRTIGARLLFARQRSSALPARIAGFGYLVRDARPAMRTGAGFWIGSSSARPGARFGKAQADSLAPPRILAAVCVDRWRAMRLRHRACLRTAEAENKVAAAPFRAVPSGGPRPATRLRLRIQAPASINADAPVEGAAYYS